MTRFGSPPRTSPRPAAAGHARVFTLVLALVVVLLLMSEAGKAKNWRWLWYPRWRTGEFLDGRIQENRYSRVRLRQSI